MVEGVYELGSRRQAVLLELKERAVEAAVGNGAIHDTCQVGPLGRHSCDGLCRFRYSAGGVPVKGISAG